MKRREFIISSGMLAGTIMVPQLSHADRPRRLAEKGWQDIEICLVYDGSNADLKIGTAKTVRIDYLSSFSDCNGGWTTGKLFGVHLYTGGFDVETPPTGFRSRLRMVRPHHAKRWHGKELRQFFMTGWIGAKKAPRLYGIAQHVWDIEQVTFQFRESTDRWSDDKFEALFGNKYDPPSRRLRQLRARQLY